ncbi:uncharacterized protein C8orf74 homolog [Argonauta hians]
MNRITIAEAKYLAQLPQGIAAEDTLRRYLNLPPCDRTKDVQYSLYLEIVHSHLRFSIDKGFTWTQVCQIPFIAAGLLQKVKIQKFPSFLHYVFSEANNWVDLLGVRNFKLYVDFLCKTIIQHFFLYKFVLSSTPRKVPLLTLVVHAPKEPDPLVEAQAIEVWNYEQHLLDLTLAEQELAKLYVLSPPRDTKNMFNQVMGSADEPIDPKDLESLLKDVTSVYCTKLLEILVSNIENKHQEMLISITRAILPRPNISKTNITHHQTVQKVSKKRKSLKN